MPMSSSQARAVLYRTARILGDVQAAQNGTLPERQARKIVYSALWKIATKIVR